MDNLGTCYLIKPDGSLWKGSESLKSDLLKQGWREVHNPKRSYYPEYDQSHPSHRNETIIEEGKENILNVEMI